MKVFFDIITNHTADVIDYREASRPAYVSKDQKPYQRRERPRVRRPRLRRHEPLPGAERDRVVPVHAVPPGRLAAQGARLAQRPHALPQPRQHDVRRRELPVRRLLRPRRPVHRAPAGRARDGGHLQGVDRRLRDRRLPHRHDEARRRRRSGSVRARRAALRAPPGQARVLHVRRGVRHLAAVHVALHDDRPRAGRDRLPVPGRGARLRRRSQPTDSAARLLRSPTTGTPTGTPTRTSCRRSWATTTWGGSASSSATPTPARPTPRCSPATGWRTS